MFRDELNSIFEKYLNRLPSAEDVRSHIGKTVEEFEAEIARCEERVAILKKNPTDDNLALIKKITIKKIAILLSGHIRHLTVLESLRGICRDYDTDVFVHTWDNYGVKGSETNLEDSVNPYSVEQSLKTIPGIAKYKIENNKDFIQNLPKPDFKYFNYSSPEVFIKSQLYSIHQSYNLMEEYAKENDIKYDMVIRCRMDLSFFRFEPDNTIFDDIRNKIIFVPNGDCGHSHPDHGTSCHLCNKLYYELKVKGVHLIDHPSIPCDIFAYGSMESMKEYCNLYNNYDKMLKKYEKQNLASLLHNKIKHTLIDNVYKLDGEEHLRGIYLLNCSYPEKMLQLHLKDYMLVESKKIKVKHHK